MIITAKYAARCPVCSQSIAAGSKIEWSKGAPAKHVSCAGGTVQARSATAARSSRYSLRGKWTGCACGSIEDVARKSDCTSCRYDWY